MSAAVLHLPAERANENSIVRALMPFVEQAIRERPGDTDTFDLHEIAEAALRLIDPESVGPALIRTGCLLSLQEVARALLDGDRP